MKDTYKGLEQLVQNKVAAAIMAVLAFLIVNYQTILKLLHNPFSMAILSMGHIILGVVVVTCFLLYRQSLIQTTQLKAELIKINTNISLIHEYNFIKNKLDWFRLANELRITGDKYSTLHDKDLSALEYSKRERFHLQEELIKAYPNKKVSEVVTILDTIYVALHT